MWYKETYGNLTRLKYKLNHSAVHRQTACVKCNVCVTTRNQVRIIATKEQEKTGENTGLKLSLRLRGSTPGGVRSTRAHKLPWDARRAYSEVTWFKQKFGIWQMSVSLHLMGRITRCAHYGHHSVVQETAFFFFFLCTSSCRNLSDSAPRPGGFFFFLRRTTVSSCEPDG